MYPKFNQNLKRLCFLAFSAIFFIDPTASQMACEWFESKICKKKCKTDHTMSANHFDSLSYYSLGISVL